MPSRLRSRIYNHPDGHYTYVNGSTTSVSTKGSSFTKTCTDVVGNFPVPNPLTVSWSDSTAAFATGAYHVGTQHYKLQGYPCTGNFSFTSANDPPGMMSESDMITRALSVANPNRPIVSLGGIAQDIWEFPKFVKDLFEIGLHIKSHPRSELLHQASHNSGKNYLTYQFGALPLIGDLITCMSFVNSVQKRLVALDALAKTGGLSRKTKFGINGSDSYDNGKPVSVLFGTSTPYASNLTAHVSNVYRHWVTTHYKLLDWSPIKHNKASQDTANSLLGLNFNNSLLTVWQLMPWTWLIDWFENVRDVYQAGNNSLGIYCDYACHMVSTDCYINSVTGTSVGLGFTLNPNFGPHTRKRTVVMDPSPSLSFHIPFLDGGQLSILYALTQSKTWVGRVSPQRV